MTGDGSHPPPRTTAESRRHASRSSTGLATHPCSKIQTQPQHSYAASLSTPLTLIWHDHSLSRRGWTENRHAHRVTQGSGVLSICPTVLYPGSAVRRHTGVIAALMLQV